MEESLFDTIGFILICILLFSAIIILCYEYYKKKQLKCLLINKIPFRVVINNILIYHEFQFNYNNKFKDLYGRFKMDKSKKIFLIWKSCAFWAEDIIPKNIQNLRLIDSWNDSSNVNLPKNITNLVISCCKIPDKIFNKLNKNLRGVSISLCNNFHDGDNLPQNLKFLVVNNCINFTGNNLPENLKSLSVWNCENFISNNLPENLKYLKVEYCQNFISNNLPESLKYLKVFRCGNFIGNNFPENLKYLKVSHCRNFIGNNLPKNLINLKIRKCPKFDRGKLSWSERLMEYE